MIFFVYFWALLPSLGRTILLVRQGGGYTYLYSNMCHLKSLEAPFRVTFLSSHKTNQAGYCTCTVPSHSPSRQFPVRFAVAGGSCLIGTRHRDDSDSDSDSTHHQSHPFQDIVPHHERSQGRSHSAGTPVTACYRREIYRSESGEFAAARVGCWALLRGEGE